MIEQTSALAFDTTNYTYGNSKRLDNPIIYVNSLAAEFSRKLDISNLGN